jgi:electron transfer flavoprotein alpha subunit
MAAIVFIDHDEGAFNPNSLGVLAMAASLGGDVTAFVAGSGIDDGWAAGLGAHGASRVLVADDAALTGLPQPIVDALEPHAWRPVWPRDWVPASTARRPSSRWPTAR